MFARRYPERVSGLVFVDAANSEMLSIANSTRGWAQGSWRLVRNSGHLIASDQPQAVVDAVLDILNAHR
jgi:pimeloyl-ACP methyl ester carboxylesterase